MQGDKRTGGERLLVVEDEPHLAEVIADNLVHEGFEVETVGDGLSALTRVREVRPALVLLDVMLPGMDGFRVCETLRAEGNDVPILFLTAKCDDDDRVRGLELGGDDFLGKPFDLRELLLRVKAILRRTEWADSTSSAGDVVTLGKVSIDLRSFVAHTADGDVELSPKEALILRCLAERSGEVVAREEILDRVWGYDAFPTTRTIDNFIVRLRRVVEPDPRSPRFIHTIRGVGYRLTP